MAGLTEAQLLGRRIELLFTSSSVAITANSRLYTMGTSPWITPSNAEYIAYVSVALSTGADPGTGTMSFGTSSGNTGWTTAVTLSAYSEAIPMIQPLATAASRPSIYGNGTAFWVNPSNFNAGATAVFKLYGWVY